MNVVDVTNLRKTFGSVVAVDDVTFSVAEGEVVVLVGASGCGKTTILRCIAGLEVPTEGTIHLKGQLVASSDHAVPPERRGVGMVFQSYALWPHKTVIDNVMYGLKLKGLGRPDAQELAQAIIAVVGLEGLEHRYPSALSGGQQQRVALARSAVTEPSLLLLDEPLGNLDANLRARMRSELHAMVHRLGMTAIHITHDQVEAMALADRVIVMRRGRIEQVGPPREVYLRPNSTFVAEFIGSANTWPATIKGQLDEKSVTVEFASGLVAEARLHNGAQAGNGDVVVSIRPEDVELSRPKAGGANGWDCIVTGALFLGPTTQYELDVQGNPLRALSPIEFQVGEQVTASLGSDQLLCLPLDS
jgi:ABC-type Fe3+/spermidine/putrescine transport system ATPase subunit